MICAIDGPSIDLYGRWPWPRTRIAELVETLLAAPVPLAIVTSKAREMTGRTLEVCRVGHAFPVVVTADDVARGKPDPEPVHRALEALAGGPVPPERALFVGDSPHDIVAGRAAGVRTVAVEWGAADPETLRASGPAYVIRTPGDLLDL